MSTTCARRWSRLRHRRSIRHRCFTSNSTTSGGDGPDRLAIVDVTNKSAPTVIAQPTYAGSGFIHQGWLTEDHRYFLVDDELDEQGFAHNTKTYMWDLTDLDAPVLIGAPNNRPIMVQRCAWSRPCQTCRTPTGRQGKVRFGTR